MMASYNLFFDNSASSAGECGTEYEEDEEEDEEKAEDGAECYADHCAGRWTVVEIGICGWYYQDLLLSFDY